jgi:hypothetical protein
MARKAKPPLAGSFHKLGSEHSDGAMYLVQDRAGIIRAFVEMMKAEFVAEFGRRPRPDEEILIWAQAKEQQEAAEAGVRSQGVPARFAKLFASASKSDQQRALGAGAIRGSEFHAACFNCADVGYRHESHAWEFVPDHLEPSVDEAAALAKGGDDQMRHRLLKKVGASFNERKRVVVHVFRELNGAAWHILYFTLRDMFGDPQTKEHHWSGGSHVHYLSHAYVRAAVDEVLRRFETGDWKFPSDHVEWDGDA